MTILTDLGLGWLVERSIDPRLLIIENPSILFAEIQVFEYIESKLGIFPDIEVCCFLLIIESIDDDKIVFKNK